MSEILAHLTWYQSRVKDYNVRVPLHMHPYNLYLDGAKYQLFLFKFHSITYVYIIW